MRAPPRIVTRVLLIGLMGSVPAGLPVMAQEPAAPRQQQSYRGLEVQSTTYTWLAAAAMLAGTMVIAFRKPKRVASP